MKEKIVVVDDDAMSLKTVRRVFDRAGMEGRYFCSWDEFSTCLEAEYMPDLFLLDVHMPDVNGLDLLRRLRTVPAYRNIPVIFLTGDEDVKTETAGLQAGASDFIRKPFAAEVLLKRVRNTIELHRLHNDMAEEIRSKTEKLSHAYIQIVQALAASVDAKDKYTHGHSSRVAAYSREIAKRAGIRDVPGQQSRLSDRQRRCGHGNAISGGGLRRLSCQAGPRKDAGRRNRQTPPARTAYRKLKSGAPTKPYPRSQRHQLAAARAWILHHADQLQDVSRTAAKWVAMLGALLCF
ncbi:MAG: response regulator [Anaerolineaceae bacterium]|nr:response regulator [Anaerolineaceae bacterium]